MSLPSDRKVREESFTFKYDLLVAHMGPLDSFVWLFITTLSLRIVYILHTEQVCIKPSKLMPQIILPFIQYLRLFLEKL